MTTNPVGGCARGLSGYVHRASSGADCGFRQGPVCGLALVLMAAFAVSGCSSGIFGSSQSRAQLKPPAKVYGAQNTRRRSGTYNRYGVPTSSRVVHAGRIPKGGGVRKIGKPYYVSGQRFVPRHDPSYDRSGIASWYGRDFHGRKTANGEVYDMNALTAAHPTLPLPSYAYVTNKQNGKTLLVRVNDRGPFVKNRIIDLSHRSARELGFFNQGTAHVRVRYAGPAPLNGDDSRERRFLADSRGRVPARSRYSSNGKYQDRLQTGSLPNRLTLR